MSARFWFSFVAAAIASAAALGVAGWLVSYSVSSPPPERFVSPVFEFDLPKNWKCIKEGIMTTCRSKKSPKTAACILVTMDRGPKDTLEKYTQHLSSPIDWKNKAGSNIRSEVIRVGRRVIGTHTWFTGMHFQSEVENYYTDYYAILTSHSAVLVTFSAHKKHLAKHREEFETMISSLRVHQQL